jgi:hypothetical protein
MAVDNGRVSQRQALPGAFADFFSREKRSKTRERISTGMPAPVSVTAILAHSPSRRVLIVMAPFPLPFFSTASLMAWQS